MFCIFYSVVERYSLIISIALKFIGPILLKVSDHFILFQKFIYLAKYYQIYYYIVGNILFFCQTAVSGLILVMYLFIAYFEQL